MTIETANFEERAFDFFCNGEKACDEFSVAILRRTKICNFNRFFQSSAKASKVSRFEWNLHQTLLPTLRWARVKMRRVHQKLRILFKISWVNFFSRHPVSATPADVIKFKYEDCRSKRDAHLASCFLRVVLRSDLSDQPDSDLGFLFWLCFRRQYLHVTRLWLSSALTHFNRAFLCRLTSRLFRLRLARAGEMIREVGGLGLGALEEKGPHVSQRAQNHLYNYCNCWKTVQEK